MWIICQSSIMHAYPCRVQHFCKFQASESIRSELHLQRRVQIAMEPYISSDKFLLTLICAYNSGTAEQISTEIDADEFYKKSSSHVKFPLKQVVTDATWGGRCISAHISNGTRQIFMGVKNVPRKRYREKLNEPFRLNFSFFFSLFLFLSKFWSFLNRQNSMRTIPSLYIQQ